ncbi:MAG: cupredoxin domain-containing protein [Actinomycetota bacterium]
MYLRTRSACALTLLLAGCAGSAERSAGVTSGPATGTGAVRIEMGDNVFDPQTLRVSAGDEVVLEIANVGDAAHDFTIEQLDLASGVVAPGQVVTATFTAPGETIEFVCTLHRGMDGAIEVSGERGGRK